ncbi:MAG: TetR/AcrR family transcriptional regulator [Kiloniellales bacterium]|nr:TetR/AcrR family transcriptional regulator [Kiloniellales bacterium]
MTASRRDDLVKTAVELFYRHGYHATGIEKILTEAGVSKPTLYRHFDSKDELIVAALNRWDGESRAWLEGEMARRGTTPREQILALFDTLGDWFREPGFQGCMFINAAVEFADQDNPIHQAAADHKRQFAAHLRNIVAAAGAPAPDELTDRLMLLMEGAIVTAHTCGDDGAAARAKAMAEDLLAQALDKG